MFKKLLAHANRGILLDVVVFLVNVVLMTFLSRLLADLIQQAKTDIVAQEAMVVFCLALVFLQPIGALLKRWCAHLRRPDLDHVPGGPLFPVAYFLAQLIFLIAGLGNLLEIVMGKNQAPESADYFGLPFWLFTTLFLGVPALAAANAFIVYFYFQPPKRKPLFAWLAAPQTELLGDSFLFLNMIGYQAFWGLLMNDLTNDYSSIIGRLSMFIFSALLIYFPPRIFYLAEDGKRRIVWLTMLLANLPILLRILIASSAKSFTTW